jgi:hypothetical protein
MRERLIVIGGDAAGMSAASQAKRLRGDDLTVIGFERGKQLLFGVRHPLLDCRRRVRGGAISRPLAG